MAPPTYSTNDTNYNDTIELFEQLWNETSSQTNSSCDDKNGSCLWNQTVAHSEDQYSAQAKVYWALVMIPLPLVAVVGNILVILSVYKEKNLQSATNYFIVSLAFADLLVAAVVMPFAVYVLVNVDWELSDTLCDFYIALDVTCSTASIFNLVAISVDRFIAVTKPIQYSKHKNGKRILLTIVFVWLVSAAIGSPIVLGLNTSPERQPNLCVFYNSDFIIYSSLSSFYIPCLLMVYLYYKIFRAIHERARRALGGQQKGQAKGLKAEKKDADKGPFKSHPGVSYIKPLAPLIEGDEVSQMGPSDNNIDDEDYDEDSPGTTSNAPVVSTSFYATAETTSNVISTADTTSSRPNVPSFRLNGSLVSDSNVVVEDKKKRNRFGLGKTEKQKKKKKKQEKNAARRERKATKTLAIVLGVFLICWVPFFTCNILDAICIKLENDTWRPGVNAFLLTTWLGYINSCVNPVIYTIFNIEFRKAFTKLLLEPCK